MACSFDPPGRVAHIGAPEQDGVGGTTPGDAVDAAVGTQRLLDAWARATLAERNAFLWLAAEEIQAAQEGEYQNAPTTPQAPGNGPVYRPAPDRQAPGRRAHEHGHCGLSAADLAAAEAEAVAWLDEEAAQARLWRDDAAAAQAQGIPMPWEELKRTCTSRLGDDTAPS